MRFEPRDGDFPRASPLILYEKRWNAHELKNLKQTIQSIKARVAWLKKEIIVLYFVYTDPRVGLIPKVLIFVTLGYALSPIDLIPDFIPVLGYLDDLIILPALVALSLKLIPAEIKKEARLKADREPCKLKKNWILTFLQYLSTEE